MEGASGTCWVRPGPDFAPLNSPTVTAAAAAAAATTRRTVARNNDDHSDDDSDEDSGDGGDASSASKCWSRSIDLRGFRASEVSVRLDKSALRVAAVRVDDASSPDDVTETRRTMTLPPAIRSDALRVRLSRGGFLLVRAPFKEAADCDHDAAADGGSDRREVWREVRQLLARGGADDRLADGPSGRVYRAEVGVSDYSTEEVRVRVLGDCVLVEAEHSEERPGQKIRRKLERSFRPPVGTDLGGLVSRMSLDGRLLLLEAPYRSSASSSSKFSATSGGLA